MQRKKERLQQTFNTDKNLVPMQNINMQQTWNTEHIKVYFRSKYASDLKHREKLTSNTSNVNICLTWNTEKENKSWSQIKICHRHRIQQKLQAYLKYKYAHYQAYKAKVKNRMHTITRAAISQFREIIQHGPLYVGTVCHQTMLSQSNQTLQEMTIFQRLACGCCLFNWTLHLWLWQWMCTLLFSANGKKGGADLLHLWQSRAQRTSVLHCHCQQNGIVPYPCWTAWTECTWVTANCENPAFHQNHLPLQKDNRRQFKVPLSACRLKLRQQSMPCWDPRMKSSGPKSN